MVTYDWRDNMDPAEEARIMAAIRARHRARHRARRRREIAGAVLAAVAGFGAMVALVYFWRMN